MATQARKLARRNWVHCFLTIIVQDIAQVTQYSCQEMDAEHCPSDNSTGEGQLHRMQTCGVSRANQQQHKCTNPPQFQRVDRMFLFQHDELVCTEDVHLDESSNYEKQSNCSTAVRSTETSDTNYRDVTKEKEQSGYEHIAVLT